MESYKTYNGDFCCDNYARMRNNTEVIRAVGDRIVDGKVKQHKQIRRQTSVAFPVRLSFCGVRIQTHVRLVFHHVAHICVSVVVFVDERTNEQFLLFRSKATTLAKEGYCLQNYSGQVADVLFFCDVFHDQNGTMHSAFRKHVTFFVMFWFFIHGDNE